jgi:hypothetical protein
VWYSRELARDELMEFKIQVRTMSLVWFHCLYSGEFGSREPSTKLSLFLALSARVMAFCHFGKLSPVRRPETRTRLGESEGWRVYGKETMEVGGEDVELEEDEEAMEVSGRDCI